ncbi:hypothetical protein BJ912DRAFT_1111464 [Pholiota molesta]|nr:hypothetical protein BJ912DRAFT_1111464 [Pholiota molesta]
MHTYVDDAIRVSGLHGPQHRREHADDGASDLACHLDVPGGLETERNRAGSGHVSGPSVERLRPPTDLGKLDAASEACRNALNGTWRAMGRLWLDALRERAVMRNISSSKRKDGWRQEDIATLSKEAPAPGHVSRRLRIIHACVDPVLWPIADEYQHACTWALCIEGQRAIENGIRNGPPRPLISTIEGTAESSMPPSYARCSMLDSGFIASLSANAITMRYWQYSGARIALSALQVPAYHRSCWCIRSHVTLSPRITSTH